VPLLFRFAGRQNIECEKMHYEFAGQSRNFKFKLNLKYASSASAINRDSDPRRRRAAAAQ
jgi:hypothetical protein